MRIVNAYVEILSELDGDRILRSIETYARTAHKTEGKGTNESTRQFVRRLIAQGHLSVVEHEIVTFRVVCDRAIAHQITRHRIASYTQESTRYCDYSDERFGGQITVIRPPFWPEGSTGYSLWLQAMGEAERAYVNLIATGSTPEQARVVLPLGLKTELVMTMNLRQWRHFLSVRTGNDAHPQIRSLALSMLEELQSRIPIVFDDLVEEGKPA